MTAEQMIDTFRIVIEEGFNKGNVAALDGCFNPTLTEHQFDLPSTRAEFKNTILWLRATMADFQLTIEDITVADDTVWARMTARGTNVGEFMGRAPTNRSFAITVFDACRFEDGKIVEHWGVPDRFHMLIQLGLIPGPPVPQH